MVGSCCSRPVGDSGQKDVTRTGPRAPSLSRGADTRAGRTWVAPRVEPVTEGGHMAEEQHDTIDDLFTELRHFPPPEGFKADALVTGTYLYDEAAADDEGFWARQAADLSLVEAVGHDPRLGAAVRQVVRRRRAQRVVQLPRPPRRGRPRRQGGDPLGGRARRQPHDHLRRAARRGAAVRQRAEESRSRQGRPGQHLHADDPRGRGRDARLRPHRRRRTASCSAASRRRRSPIGSTTPRRRC